MALVKIAVTGTPGTGKTVVAKLLAEKLGSTYVDLNPILLKDYKIDYDDDIESWEVDIDTAAEDVKFGANSVIDGHLSHIFKVDVIVVLRCDPNDLTIRLAKRGWKENKIIENVEAEGLNVISDEAHDLVKEGRRVIEVDTTNKKPEAVVQEILEYLDHPDRKSAPLDFVDKLPVQLDLKDI